MGGAVSVSRNSVGGHAGQANLPVKAQDQHSEGQGPLPGQEKAARIFSRENSLQSNPEIAETAPKDRVLSGTDALSSEGNLLRKKLIRRSGGYLDLNACEDFDDFRSLDFEAAAKKD